MKLARSIAASKAAIRQVQDVGAVAYPAFCEECLTKGKQGIEDCMNNFKNFEAAKWVSDSMKALDPPETLRVKFNYYDGQGDHSFRASAIATMPFRVDYWPLVTPAGGRIEISAEVK